MSEFASAAMVRVLRQGMRELGMDPGGAAHDPGGADARVSLDTKRRVVAVAVEQGGFACLARLGRGLHRHSHEPTHRALCSASDAAELFARWRRLEGYIHSSHRTEVVALEPDRAEVRHVSAPGHDPPQPVEDLVVLGVLASLLEAIGCTDVRARIDGIPVLPIGDERALRRLAQRGATARWTIRWRTPPAGAVPASPRASPLPSDLMDAAPWPEIAIRAARVLLARPMHPPAVAALAAELRMATRSFQRALAGAGLRYSLLLAEARCRAAAWWLLHSASPLAEVGFLSGYSDQPHFTREFRRRVGMTPAVYRSEFAAT